MKDVKIFLKDGKHTVDRKCISRKGWSNVISGRKDSSRQTHGTEHQEACIPGWATMTKDRYEEEGQKWANAMKSAYLILPMWIDKYPNTPAMYSFQKKTRLQRLWLWKQIYLIIELRSLNEILKEKWIFLCKSVYRMMALYKIVRTLVLYPWIVGVGNHLGEN